MNDYEVILDTLLQLDNFIIEYLKEYSISNLKNLSEILLTRERLVNFYKEKWPSQD